MNQDESCLHLGFLIFPGFPMSCLTSMIEPVMILVMGVAVSFIVVSILLPIFEMNQLIR